MCSLLPLTFVLIVSAAFTAVGGQAPPEEKEKSIGLLGVNPKDAALYSGPTFTCPGSGKVIPIEQVNDDFCDCPYVEGVTVTDEPGTGACQNGVFYCANRKFRPETLHASRVNDGVCDCCDGTDEWKEVGGVKCPSECAAISQRIYEEEKAQLDALGNALEARRSLAAKAQKDLDALRSELNKLKFGDLPKPESVQSVVNIKLGTDEIPDEELNKVSMYEEEDESHHRGENGGKHDGLGDAAVDKDDDEEADDIPPEDLDSDKSGRDSPLADSVDDVRSGEKHDESDNDEESGNDNDEYDSDSDDDSDRDHDKDDELTFWKIVLSSMKKTWRSICKGTKKFIYGKSGRYPSLAERIKWPFRYASAKITSIVQGKPMPKGIKKYKLGPKPKKEEIRKERENKHRIREIEGILKIDFDHDSCFYSMYNNCTSVKQGQYKYEVCPFKSGSQSGTNLGNWDEWKKAEGSKPSYVMLYKGGSRCFNGVERSLTVIVECGPEYMAVEASEPAMCEYQMRITSPCACSQAEYDNLLKNIKHLEEELKD